MLTNKEVKIDKSHKYVQN